MAQFIVRVELHGAPEEGYAVLHKKMEAAGFSRTIFGTKPAINYHLPTGLYVITAQDTISHVIEVAKSQAWATGYAHAVIGAEVAGQIVWNGLKPV